MVGTQGGFDHAEETTQNPVFIQTDDVIQRAFDRFEFLAEGILRTVLDFGVKAGMKQVNQHRRDLMVERQCAFDVLMAERCACLVQITAIGPEHNDFPPIEKPGDSDHRFQYCHTRPGGKHPGIYRGYHPGQFSSRPESSY